MHSDADRGLRVYYVYCKMKKFGGCHFYDFGKGFVQGGWEINAAVMLIRDCLANVSDGPVEF